MRNPLKDPVVNTKQMLARKPQGKIMGFSKGCRDSLVKKGKHYVNNVYQRFKLEGILGPRRHNDILTYFRTFNYFRIIPKRPLLYAM